MMEGKKKFQWLKDMEEVLIEEVKKHTFLYNPKDPLHVKRTLKTRTYLKLSERMAEEYPQFKEELTPEEVSRKFVNLRKYYIKEAKKVMLDPSGSKECKWEHFEKLSFLDEYLLMESNSKALPFLAMPRGDRPARPSHATALQLFSKLNQLDESANISCDKVMQDTTGVPSSSTQTVKLKNSKTIETAESAIAKAAAALEKIASTLTADISFNVEAGVPSSSTQAFKRKKRMKVETEDYVMAKAADALERIANAPRKTPEELFTRYYSERILRIKNPMLKRRLKLELEELISRYEEEDEELSNMR